MSMAPEVLQAVACRRGQALRTRSVGYERSLALCAVHDEGDIWPGAPLTCREPFPVPQLLPWRLEVRMAQKRPEDCLALDWKLGVGFGKIWVLNHRQLGGQTSEFWTFFLSLGGKGWLPALAFLSSGPAPAVRTRLKEDQE